jgi:inner membrane protein
MSPVTHFFAGWILASAFPADKPTSLTKREKALVVAAALAPDLDGIGIIPELLTRNSSHPLLWFSQYHHSLHTLAFALVCALVAYLIAGPGANLAAGSVDDPNLSVHRAPTHPWMTALLVFVSFHLHLLCDLIGARGPDGYQWPIPYLKPFTNAWQLTWHGQWALNGWQNFVVTGLFLAVTLWIAGKYGSSPLELVSENMNRAFTQVVSRRLGFSEV